MEEAGGSRNDDSEAPSNGENVPTTDDDGPPAPSNEDEDGALPPPPKVPRIKVEVDEDDEVASHVNCEACSRSFDSQFDLLEHLKFSDECGSHYGNDRLQQMEEEEEEENEEELLDGLKEEAVFHEEDDFEGEEYEGDDDTTTTRRRRIKLEEEEEDPSWDGADGDRYEDDEYLPTSSSPAQSEQCKVCMKSFKGRKGLARHIGHSKRCKAGYGDDGDEYDPAMAVSAEVARIRARSGYWSNREERLQKSKDYYHRTKDQQAARIRRMEYYRKNRDEKLQKQKEYYRRNRDLIKTKKRQDSKSATSKSGKYSINKAAAVPEPEHPHGVFNEDYQLNSEGYISCRPVVTSYQGPADASTTKLEDCAAAQHLDEHTALAARPVKDAELPFVDAFVAMSLSQDGESVEVRELMRRDDVTVDGLIRLFHYVSAVAGVNCFTEVINERSSPVALVPCNKLVTLRNVFSKEIVANGLSVPELPEPLCRIVRSAEQEFLSTDMDGFLTSGQLLSNPGLAIRDTAAVGVRCSDPRPEAKASLILTLFSVNMVDWTFFSRHFYTVLVNWMGSKSKLTDVVRVTSCGMTAQRALEQDIRTDCLRNALLPRRVEMCEQCGRRFEFNTYVFAEVNRYKHHVENHIRTCKVCGKEFPTATERKFHQRTHRQKFFKCQSETCNYVGTTEKALETHIKFLHTSAICDTCGKEFSSTNTLYAHRQSAHQERLLDQICEVCGRGFPNQSQLRKHVKRHQVQNSRVNLGMHERAEDYKFTCTMHDNCKKYFKTEKHLRQHYRNFEKRPFPERTQRQVRPDITNPPEPREIDMFPKQSRKEASESKKKERERTKQRQRAMMRNLKRQQYGAGGDDAGSDVDDEAMAAAAALVRQAAYQFENHHYVP